MADNMKQAVAVRFSGYHFSLRTVLLAVLVFAFYCLVLRYQLAIVPFATSLVLALLLACHLVSRLVSTGTTGKLLPVVTVLSWIILYVASTGPAMFFVKAKLISPESFAKVYAPLQWLGLDPILKWYGVAWSELLDRILS